MDFFHSIKWFSWILSIHKKKTQEINWDECSVPCLKQRASQQMRAVETTHLLKLPLALRQQVMQKAALQPQKLVKIWKLHLSFGNLISMSWNLPPEIFDPRVFLVRGVLVAFSRDGLRRMELLLWNLALGSLLLSKRLTMMACKDTKSGWYFF